jgi:GT2 family glycosyltransferase
MRRLIINFAQILGGLKARLAVRRLLSDAVRMARLRLGAAPMPLPQDTGPILSFVVPVYNTKPRYLKDLRDSFLLQVKTGGACELILSDDGSTNSDTLAWLSRYDGSAGVRVVRSPRNSGIAHATNRGVAVARGIWVGLLDHDDALAPFAAALIADTLRRNPDCQFLYTDEIIADARLRPVDCFLKPAWDPVLLSGVNYINHLAVYRRDRLLEIGGLRSSFDGSQDYDLVLRYTAGLDERSILHLPYPAYLWRRDGGSYSARFIKEATEAARRALGEKYGSPDAPAPVGEAIVPDLHRIRFDEMTKEWPLVSVVIPTRDQLALISKTLEGLLQETDYPAIEVILVDNGSTDQQVLDLYAHHAQAHPSLRVLMREEQFNFSRSVNRGLEIAAGSMILLLNNDIEVTKSDWLKEMVSCMAYSATGVVGARLLYPDRRLQHAGVIVGFGDLAGHWFVGEDADHPGPMGRLRVRQRFSAVTGACMLISRSCLETVGRFDEDAFAIAYNDIDYCLRAKAAGYHVVWTPFATLIHHESASRGSDVAPEKIERFRREQGNLQKRHKTDVFEDRAVNPWCSKDRSNPVISKLTDLPEAR